MHGLVTGNDPRDRCGDLELKLENPIGFFESERLVEINDSLLQVLGCQWDRPPLLPASWDQPPLLDTLQPHRSSLSSYALEHSWVDKDPRLCITYPAYVHIFLRRVPLVVALREPLVVATSLHFRNGFSLNHGLVLWWMYNHHIASQMSSRDLLVPYSSLLTLDDQDLQRLLGPFLEIHNHQRPSDHYARVLTSSLLKPEFNRAEDALNAGRRACIHPLLLDICEHAYGSIIYADDQLASFQEQFNVLPRSVLECSMRFQILPEAEYNSLQNRLHVAESNMHDVCSSLKQRERDCSFLRSQLRDLKNSHSWKITAPFRSIANFFRP